MKLYIIGNGFDLASGLKTSFKSFKNDFMNIHYKGVVERWEKILSHSFLLEDDWSNLETSFYYIDYDYLREKKECFIISYSADNWSDSYHHDYEYELMNDLDLSISHDEYLRQWLNSINTKIKEKFRLDKNAFFLTFNYTSTLEDNYGISSDNIYHIHGSVLESSSLVLGHDKPIDMNEIEYNDEDIRYYNGENLIRKSNISSYKNTDMIIANSKIFFNKIRLIDEVIIVGHGYNSIETVDNKYYKEIFRLIGKDVKITVVCYKKEDIVNYIKVLKKIGFEKINTILYSDIQI